MTSMLLTERRGAEPPGLLPGTVTRRDSLLLGVRRRGFLDLGLHDRFVGLDPVADKDPLRSVPLLELHAASALVIRAGDLDRLEQVRRSELLQAPGVDV